MYIITPLLSGIMSDYDILSLENGKKQDKLGDVFEDFALKVLSDDKNLTAYQAGNLSDTDLDGYIFKFVLDSGLVPNKSDIIKIETTNNIDRRDTGGNAKTDLIAIFTYKDASTYKLPIGIKQTTAKKVAVAEFDVDTIAREVGITDTVLIEYLLKHQTDASAKNFTESEKQDFITRLRPHAVDLVRWVITGNRLVDTNDLRCPKLFIQFNISKDLQVKDIKIMNVDQYVDTIMKTPNGATKKGGFETGLAWTYATGSKGHKIQFKA